MKNEDWILKVDYEWGEGKNKCWKIYGTIGRRSYVAESEEEARECYIESAMGAMEHATEEDKEIMLRSAEFDIAVDERKAVLNYDGPFIPQQFKIDIDARGDYIYGKKTLTEAVDWYFAETAKALEAKNDNGYMVRD